MKRIRRYGVIISLILCLFLGQGVMGGAQAEIFRAPESVSFAALPPRVLEMSVLPAFGINLAYQNFKNGTELEWMVIEQQQNFSLVRQDDGSGLVIFAAFIGIQRLNLVWTRQTVSGQLQVRQIDNVARLPVRQDLVIGMDGVSAEDLSIKVSFITEQDGKLDKWDIERRILRVEVTPVVINGDHFLLRNFIIDLKLMKNKKLTSRGEETYIPILGMIHRFQQVAPAVDGWHFSNYIVSDNRLKMIQKANLE